MVRLLAGMLSFQVGRAQAVFSAGEEEEEQLSVLVSYHNS